MFKEINRKTYEYDCSDCGKKRKTVKLIRAELGQCTVCEKNKIDENQLSLI